MSTPTPSVRSAAESSAPPQGMQLVRGKTDRRQVVSVMGPSGRVYSGTVCCLLPPANRVRLGFIWIMEQWWFDSISLVVIIVNSLVLAVQGPPNNPDSPIPDAMEKPIELFFTIIFTVEMFIKIFALGFACNRARPREKKHAHVDTREK